MSDVLDLMGPEGVNLAAELAMLRSKRGNRRALDYLEFGTFRGKSFGRPLCRAVFSLFAKTMRAKRGVLEDGGAELGE